MVKVSSDLARYMRKYHPNVPFSLRSNGCKGIGLPNIVILERRSKYIALSLWVSSTITDIRMDQIDKYEVLGHAVGISSDYEKLVSCITSYLSLPEGEYTTDNAQLKYIREWNKLGVSTVRRPLTPNNIDMLYDIAAYVTVKYKYSSTFPSFGTGSGPDITIFTGDSLRGGIVIWLGSNRECNNLSHLSLRQYRQTIKLARMSYLILSSNDYDDLVGAIDSYFLGEFDGYNNLPEFDDGCC